MPLDHHGLPVGEPVPGWQPRPLLGDRGLIGRTCSVVPYEPSHVPGLHRALDLESPDALWAYYPGGPYRDEDALGAWLHGVMAGPDVAGYTILARTGTHTHAPAGMATHMRMDPANGVAEVGNVVLGSALARTTAATESMYLLMQHAFDAGYRRYEWKCDELNAPSRRAARRLGFSYEGTFRRAKVYRDRNRDTAWYAIIADDWPPIRDELRRWLAPENFDAAGGQRTRLDVASALGYEPRVSPRDLPPHSTDAGPDRDPVSPPRRGALRG